MANGKKKFFRDDPLYKAAVLGPTELEVTKLTPELAQIVDIVGGPGIQPKKKKKKRQKSIIDKTRSVLPEVVVEGERPLIDPLRAAAEQVLARNAEIARNALAVNNQTSRSAPVGPTLNDRIRAFGTGGPSQPLEQIPSDGMSLIDLRRAMLGEVTVEGERPLVNPEEQAVHNILANAANRARQERQAALPQPYPETLGGPLAKVFDFGMDSQVQPLGPVASGSPVETTPENFVGPTIPSFSSGGAMPDDITIAADIIKARGAAQAMQPRGPGSAGELPLIEGDDLTPFGAPAPQEIDGLAKSLKSFSSAIQTPGFLKTLAQLGMSIGAGNQGIQQLGQHLVSGIEGEAEGRLLSHLTRGLPLENFDSDLMGLSSEGRAKALEQFETIKASQRAERELDLGERDVATREKRADTEAKDVGNRFELGTELNKIRKEANSITRMGHLLDYMAQMDANDARRKQVQQQIDAAEAKARELNPTQLNLLHETVAASFIPIAKEFLGDDQKGIDEVIRMFKQFESGNISHSAVLSFLQERTPEMANAMGAAISEGAERIALGLMKPTDISLYASVYARSVKAGLKTFDSMEATNRAFEAGLINDGEEFTISGKVYKRVGPDAEEVVE